ncbi:MAG: hypothetical protein OHK0039_39330 [Bacteroidia bacterium]
MAIITLTSDLGNDNHYPAVVKGILLSHCPGVTIVDVTHNIPSFDIMQAAYALRHAFRAFPAGTTHIVAVDPEQERASRSVLMYHEGHLFIGPDNGVMSLIAEGVAVEARAIHNETLFLDQYPRSLRVARVLAPVAAYLACGGEPTTVGPVVSLRDLRWGDPTYNGNCLRGKIIHIDKFGNAVTNIRRHNFLEIKQERRFEIFIRNVRLRRIVNTYSDVAKADALAIFGESDNLEIAMREASAAELLGLKIHDMITIEFSV